MAMNRRRRTVSRLVRGQEEGDEKKRKEISGGDHLGEGKGGKSTADGGKRLQKKGKEPAGSGTVLRGKEIRSPTAIFILGMGEGPISSRAPASEYRKSVRRANGIN